MSAKTFHELCDEVRKNVKECTVEDVMKMIDEKEEFELIDVREDNEYHQKHIKSAKHIGKGILERDISMHIPQTDKKIVLYCGGGYRSLLAAESVQRLGYSNVYSMHGGWKGWLKAGGDTE